MEGKELYNNEDEELDPKSKKEEEDADDFGLPEIEDSDDKASDLGDPYSESLEDKKDEEETSYADSSDDYAPSTYSSDADYTYSDEADDDVGSSEDETTSSYYEEKYEQKKSPVGWIIFGVFVLIAIIVAVFWWLNRDTKPEPIPTPVVVQPVQEQEPEIIEEEPEPVAPVKTPGVFELNEPTGRYHVIVASSIDVDLIRDYGNKLAKQGMTCNIIAPRGSKNFHRLSVDDYVSLNDATLKSEQLKATLGQDVWVIRY